MFERKAYRKLKIWKEKYSKKYAALLEGARRVGKSTIAEEFAKREFRSYIVVDFAHISDNMRAVFDDIADLDIFFLRLQTVSGVKLYEHESVVVFDEIQRAPKVREAIKYLVKDGRYNYIETGSLLSINKNVKDIVIPSEEYKIPVYPMDYEEFMWASGKETYDTLRDLFRAGKSVGKQVNAKLMRDYRLYMAVGGMPQAVEAFVDGDDFEEIDVVKRGIIELYKEDFYKVDNSGRISKIYESIPGFLALGKKRYVLSNALGKRTTDKDRDLLSDLLDSKTVLACYNTHDPSPLLAQTKDLFMYRLYLSDTGLFTTMLFNDKSEVYADIYNMMLSDSLPANLGYLYENAVAQMMVAMGMDLYYHTWKREGSSHYYEIDFITSKKAKLIPLEVKSSGHGKHESINLFCEKYSEYVDRSYLVSQKDLKAGGDMSCIPIYMLPFVFE